MAAKDSLLANGPIIGPKGDRVPKDGPIPSTWPKWFMDDLRGAGMVRPAGESGATPAAASKPEVKTAQGVSARQRKAHR
jgi:hypothetical protein